MSDYLPVFIFAAMVIGFAVGSLAIAAILRPSRPETVKLETYECGAEPGTLGPAIKTPSGTPVPDIQDDFYRIVFEEYLAWDGEIKPSGLGFTAYLNSLMAVKGTPAEEVISEFFNLSLLLP